MKKIFLKILPNSQGNTCVGDSFLIKLQAAGQQFYFKETPTQVFFYRTPPVGAPVSSNMHRMLEKAPK